MYKLQYFKSGKTICGDDFKSDKQTVYINLQQVSSISGLKKFKLMVNDEFVGYYSVVTMQNGDIFCIDKTEFKKLVSHLNCE